VQSMLKRDNSKGVIIMPMNFSGAGLL